MEQDDSMELKQPPHVPRNEGAMSLNYRDRSLSPKWKLHSEELKPKLET